MHGRAGHTLRRGRDAEIHVNMRVVVIPTTTLTRATSTVVYAHKRQCIGDTVIGAAVVGHITHTLHTAGQLVAELADLRQHNSARVATGDLANIHHRLDVLGTVGKQMHSAALQQ